VYKTIIPVTIEPVTLAEAKQHCRLSSDTTEDEHVTSLIKSAREYCENYTRRALAGQTLELLLNTFPTGNSIEIPKPPLVSVSSVKYKDSDGVEHTMPTSDYIVDTDQIFGRVVLGYNKSWPVFTPYPVNPVRIRFEAGYSYVDFPESIKHAIKLIVGHWYENREAVLTGTVSKEIEIAVKDLLIQYRAGWF